MALAAITRLVNAHSDDLAVNCRSGSEEKGNAGTSLGDWLGAVFDVKCCTMRDRSGYDPHLICAGRPTVKLQHFDATQGADDKSAPHHHRFDPELDSQPLHSSRQVPDGLIDQIASVVDRSPYMAREIAERGSRSLKLQFLKQCTLHNHHQCEKIWGTLNEHDRLDFMQILHLKGKNSDCFFSNIMEPDAQTWREEVSDYSLSEFEMKSDSGSNGSGESAFTKSSCATASTRSSEGVVELAKSRVLSSCPIR